LPAIVDKTAYLRFLMKNPSEELVVAWLQESKGYFIMNNVKVHRRGGGMGAEIDILATDKENNIWIEVSVSTNPRCNHRKEVRFKETVKDYLKDFLRDDKNAKVREIFHGEPFEKWLVHGKLALAKKEVENFPREMLKNGVKTVYFEDILKDLFELKEYRLDSARGYVNIIKAFLRDRAQTTKKS
jgi:Holliday junction resolvase-like predicted endonuclease